MTGRARRQQPTDEFTGLHRDHLVGMVQGMRVVVTEQQARLDAIAAVLDARQVVGTMVDPTIRVLARGTPKRAVVQALKRWGKKENGSK